MFKVMLDNKSYDVKPSNEELRKYINNRLVKNPIEITPEQLAQELVQGKTFIPAYLGTKNRKGYISREKECWTNQQLVCLDFDNEIMIDNPDYPHKSNEKKIKQKQVSITWDMAKAEFKDTAMFMYKSFNHKEGDTQREGHPKFRVVFAFDSVIDDKQLYIGNAQYLLNQYPYADNSSIQENRLFYGGRDLYVFNYHNRLKIDNNKKEGGGFYDPNSIGIKNIDNLGHESLLATLDEGEYSLSNKYNNVQLLSNKDITFAELTGLQLNEVTFSSREEVYDYLKRINLHDFLGIPTKSFLDLFHKETQDSASIFQSHSPPHYWYYKCHSALSPWYGSIIDVTERLTGLSKPDTIKYLCQILNVKIIKSNWQVKQEENFLYNKDFITDNSDYISKAYPYLNSILKSSDSLYYQIAREFHLIGLETIHNLIKVEDYEEGVFYASIRHIIKRIFGGSIENDKFAVHKEKRVRTNISLLVFLRMLQRHELDSLPKEYASRARKEAKGKGFKHTVEFYSIPSYTANLMIEVEKIAKMFKENAMTVGNFSRQMVLKSCGEEEADRCFPNRKGEKIAELNIKTCDQIENVLVKYIEEYGWVTEDRIIQNVPLDIDIEMEMRKRNKSLSETDVITEEDKNKWAYNYKKSQLKQYLGGLLTKYGLTRKMLSNKLMEQNEIPMHFSPNGNPSYPAVIYKMKIT